MTSIALCHLVAKLEHNERHHDVKDAYQRESNFVLMHSDLQPDVDHKVYLLEEEKKPCGHLHWIVWLLPPILLCWLFLYLKQLLRQ